MKGFRTGLLVLPRARHVRDATDISLVQTNNAVGEMLQDSCFGWLRNVSMPLVLTISSTRNLLDFALTLAKLPVE